MYSLTDAITTKTQTIPYFAIYLTSPITNERKTLYTYAWLEAQARKIARTKIARFRGANRLKCFMIESVEKLGQQAQMF